MWEKGKLPLFLASSQEKTSRTESEQSPGFTFAGVKVTCISSSGMWQDWGADEVLDVLQQHGQGSWWLCIIFYSWLNHALPTALRSWSKKNISVKQNECLQLIQDVWQLEEQKIYQHRVKVNREQLQIRIRFTGAFYSLVQSRRMALAS